MKFGGARESVRESVAVSIGQQKMGNEDTGYKGNIGSVGKRCREWVRWTLVKEGERERKNVCRKWQP